MKIDNSVLMENERGSENKFIPVTRPGVDLGAVPHRLEEERVPASTLDPEGDGL